MAASSKKKRKVDPETERMLREMAEQTERLAPRIGELMKNDPKLPVWSAMTIAQDEESMEQALVRVREEPEEWEKIMWTVGSYGRVEFATRIIEAQIIRQEQIYSHWPTLWSGSDPDDTDHRYAQIWEDMWKDRGKKTITDEAPLPPGLIFTVYRGQDEGATPGISWTLDEEIARKFSRGAATRQPNREGVVYKAKADKRWIMAYLTGRGEKEVIIHPWRLT